MAYTSDIGESFRPVAHPYLVKGAYGISWAYLTGDVLHEGYKAYQRNQRMLNPAIAPGLTKPNSTNSTLAAPKSGITPQIDGVSTQIARVPALEDYRTIMVERAVFQSFASMGLPAFTIHSIVRYSGRALKGVKNNAIRTYGPIGVSEP